MIGGVILQWLSWRWIFFVNVPIALLALIIVFVFVKNEKPDEKVHCEWLSISFLALFIATFILPIMQGPIWGWLSWKIITFFAISALSLILFIWNEKRSAQPLFRQDLFANRHFLCAAIPNGCTIGFIWVIFFIIPLYLQNVLHFSALKTGCLFLLVTLPVFFFSKLVSRSSFSYKTLMLSGFTLFALTFFLQMQFAVSFWLIAFSCLTIGISWVLVWGPAMSSALKSVSLSWIFSGHFFS